MIIKTIETYNEEETGTKNIIKTLRIYNPALGYRCMKEILLEQVTSYRYDEIIECNHISILQHEFVIYFYRKIKEDGSPISRLYKYDFLTNKLDALEGYDIEDKGDGELHLMFAQKFGY